MAASITLEDFLSIHHESMFELISIIQLPYTSESGVSNVYFDDVKKKYILNSELFDVIRKKQVDYFCFDDEGLYEHFLYIYLKEE